MQIIAFQLRAVRGPVYGTDIYMRIQIFSTHLHSYIFSVCVCV